MSAYEVGILLYDGFDQLSALGPHAVLSAATEAGDIDVTTYALVPSETLPAASGLEVAPDDVLIGTPDLVLVPGGPWADPDRPGARALAAAGEYPERVATLVENGAAVAGVDTGVLILGEAGLLDGRTVTGPEPYRRNLEEYGAEIRDAGVVEDDHLFTTRSPVQGLSLALHLVERVDGPDSAADLAAKFGIEGVDTLVMGDE